MSECILKRSEWYAQPSLDGAGHSENVPESKAVCVGEAGALNIRDGLLQHPATVGEFNNVGILNVAVPFDKACFGEPVQKGKQMLEFVRIIVRLVCAGVHTLKASTAAERAATKKEAR